MPTWRLHWLEAEGDLSPWRVRIAADVAEARARLSTLTAPPPLDVLIARRTGGFVIPEVGLGGVAYLPSLFQLACDPSNAAFEASLTGGAATRLALHEAHHCLRMAGPGYGRTLGEALASAGCDCGRWFYGTADKPRWLGYALGFEIVGRWADQARPADAAAWIKTPATEILKAAGFDRI